MKTKKVTFTLSAAEYEQLLRLVRKEKLDEYVTKLVAKELLRKDLIDSNKDPERKKILEAYATLDAADWPE